jgi:hypothetical protein
MEMMRATLSSVRLLLASVAGLLLLVAPVAAQTISPAGVIVLKPVAGSPGGAMAFDSIIWTGTNGGVATDAAGNHIIFTNEGIGRILYFDQAYYVEVDHNQNWLGWRAGLQSRETVVAAIDKVSLHPDDIPILQGDEKIFQDVLTQFPTGQSVLGPMIDTIKQDLGNLAAGEVLENGQWTSASQAGNPQAPVPTVGQSDEHVSFTTKDGRTFTNAKVVLTDTGISAVTESGGGSISFDQLPDDLSPFSAGLRDKIREARAKHAAEVAEANKPAPTWLETAQSWWTTARDFVVGLYTKYFGGGSTSSGGPAPATNAAPAVVTPADIPTALVRIKGDNAEGTGFLIRMADGPVVVTAIHVIAENPNARIFLSDGQEIFPGGLRCATDRDVAVFMIQDNSYNYLGLAADFTVLKAGDPAVIPGDASKEGSGDLLGIGTQHVEFTNPIRNAATAGSPIIDGKTNQVIAVLGSPDFGLPPSNPSEMIGLRIDTITQWEPYNQYQFVSETLALKSFHEESRALDSLINGFGLGHKTITGPDGAPDAKYYLGNDKVRALAEKFSIGPNTTSPSAPSPDFIAALKDLADDGRTKFSNPETYYAYDQPRIRTEVAYRDDIISEINDMGGGPSAPATPSPAPQPSAPATNATPPAAAPAEMTNAPPAPTSSPVPSSSAPTSSNTTPAPSAPAPTNATSGAMP